MSIHRLVESGKVGHSYSRLVETLLSSSKFVLCSTKLSNQKTQIRERFEKFELTSEFDSTHEVIHTSSETSFVEEK